MLRRTLNPRNAKAGCLGWHCGVKAVVANSQLGIGTESIDFGAKGIRVANPSQTDLVEALYECDLSTIFAISMMFCQ